MTVAVEPELRTPATTKCRSPVDGSLTVLSMWALNWVLELLFQKAVENLSVASWRGSLEADRGLHRIECLREGKGERENDASYGRKGLISDILGLIRRRILGKEIAPQS